LPQLRRDPVAVAPLHVDERAREEDERVVELAAVLPPRRLQRLVALPELAPVEEVEEAGEGGIDRLRRRGKAAAHRGRHRIATYRSRRETSSSSTYFPISPRNCAMLSYGRYSRNS